VVKKAVCVVVFLVGIALIQGVQQGPAQPQRADEDFTISIKSRTVLPPPGIGPDLLAGVFPVATGDSKFLTILQLQQIPTAKQRQTLKKLKVDLLDYLPNFAWIAALPTSPSIFDDLEALPFHRATLSLLPEDKIEPNLFAGQVGSWAINIDGTLKLRIFFVRSSTLDDRRRLIADYGGNIVFELDLTNMMRVDLAPNNVLDLAQESLVQWIEPLSPPPKVDLDGVRAAMRVNAVQAAPYELSGTGVTVGQWDGDWVDTSHPDLAGRIQIGDPECDLCQTDDHATHVAGIVAGSGKEGTEAGGTPLQWRGVAPGAHIVSFEWWNNLEEGLIEYTRAIQEDGIDLSTNSWSYNTLGGYESGNAFYDLIVRGGAGKPIPIVASAGNDGDFGWHTVAEPNIAKNTIVVGATDASDNSWCFFSSRGPTDDGRIKPDLVAPGCDSGPDKGVTSTMPDIFTDFSSSRDCDGSGDDFCFPYDSINGTSMSAPAVAGAVALLLEQYRSVKEFDPLPSTLKAILMHTAQDLGPAGPDFRFGYGLVDVKAAVDLLRDHPDDVTEAKILKQGQVDAYATEVSDQTTSIKVTLVWDDVPATLNAARTLVNDLDLVLIAPDGTEYQPWALDPQAPSAPAGHGADRINNVEQVVVERPQPGEWSWKVTAFRTPLARGESTSQPYSVVMSTN